MTKTHSDLEEMVSKAGTEWMRAMMTEHSQLRARAEARLTEVRDAEGDDQSTKAARRRSRLGLKPPPVSAGVPG